MSNKTQINTTQPVQYETTVNNHPFTISGDYESVAPIYERSSVPLATQSRSKRVSQPKAVNDALAASKAIVDTLRAKVRREKELVVYDLLHGTNYRTAYHQAMQEARNKAFEESLGLVRK